MARNGAVPPGRMQEIEECSERRDIRRTNYPIPERDHRRGAGNVSHWEPPRSENNLFLTFEAGMCMKTKKTTTICPQKYMAFTTIAG